MLERTVLPLRTTIIVLVLIVGLTLLVHVGPGDHDARMVAACLAVLQMALALVVHLIAAHRLALPGIALPPSGGIVAVIPARVGRHPPDLGTILRM